MAVLGWIVAAVVALVLIGKAVYTVAQYQRGVVETFRKYDKTATPGLTFIFPFIQNIRMVDMRETVLDVIPQDVITKDNAVVIVDAIVYYEITDPIRNLYNITDFRMAAVKLAQTNLRNIVGDLELDELLTSREEVNAKLRQILDDATDRWGVRVTRVELQTVEPPADIIQAMSRQMKAEREKRAAILEAEGIKQSEILRAEGDRQARINIAEGDRQARINIAEGEAKAIMKVADAERYRQLTVAEGEAQAIDTVYSAIHEGDPTPDLLAIKYLEALARIANGNATKVFLPLEAMGTLGSMAAIGDAFRSIQPDEDTGSTPS